MVNKGAASFDCTLVLRKNLGFFLGATTKINSHLLSCMFLDFSLSFSLSVSICLHRPHSCSLITGPPPDCGEYPRYHAIDIMCKTAMQLMYITILGNV